MGKPKAGNSKEEVTRNVGALRSAKPPVSGDPRSKDSGRSTNSREAPTPGTQKSSLAKKKPQSRGPPKNAALSHKSSKSVKDKGADDDYNEELLNRMSKALTHNPWYHGLMPRDEIEDLLTADGDFLVRKTEVAKHVRYAVTVMNRNRIRHILFNFKDDQWSLRNLKKATVTELINTHVKEKVPVMSDGTLLNPLRRAADARARRDAHDHRECHGPNPDERPDFEVLFKLVSPNEKPPLGDFESYNQKGE
ncbi:Tyrosine-protein kinase [Aphelenchoides fujianensis]|nr:Tyrosine-protein kinase [Aphelenchoides fujianensis]